MLACHFVGQEERPGKDFLFTMPPCPVDATHGMGKPLHGTPVPCKRPAGCGNRCAARGVLRRVYRQTFEMSTMRHLENAKKLIYLAKLVSPSGIEPETL